MHKCQILNLTSELVFSDTNKAEKLPPKKRDERPITAMKSKNNMGQEYKVKNSLKITGISFLFSRKRF